MLFLILHSFIITSSYFAESFENAMRLRNSTTL